MSREAQDKRAEMIGKLAGELRQFHGLGVSFFRIAASRVGMNATDLQVVDLLDSAGPATAGQLAELTGLTTGAIAQMLNRLEEAGVVRRERDPADGRRVIVRLVPGGDAVPEIGPLFGVVGEAWADLATRYDDGQLALLLEFVRRANVVSREELDRLREAPAAGGGWDFSAPLGDVGRGRLVFPSGISRLDLRVGAGMTELYRARFEGSVHEVQVEEGTVTVRYPRRLRLLGWRHRAAEIALSAAIPWRIEVRGGASEVTAALGGLDLTGLEIAGGLWKLHLDLPEPSGAVPVRITGGAAEVIIRRPSGVAARLRLKGWAAGLTFDDQTFDAVGNDVRLHSSGYEDAPRHYDIDVSGGASTVTITAG